MGESNIPFDPNSSLASREAWGAIQTLFNQAKSLLSHTCGFLDDQNIAEDEESNEQLLWQVNMTAALCLLFASERGYDDMNELHARLPELFCNSETELHEWQVALLLDIKKEIWTIGVRDNRFSRTEGLRNIFLSDYGNPMTRELQLQCSKIIPVLQETTVQNHGRQFSFEQHYGHRLKQLARSILSSTTPHSPLDACSNNGYDGIAPTDGTLDTLDTNKQFDTLQDSVERVEEGEQSALFDDDDFDRRNENLKASNPAALTVNTEYLVPRYKSAPSQASLKTFNLSEIPADSENRRFSSNAGDNLPLKQHGMGHGTPSSTQEQYEKAKLAASAKAAARNKCIPLQPSQRRPWSPEEENALMTGLDRVQGPHWSQILAMYGPDGSISEILKDRNQVQLKDKARNLKLFFLKSGHDVPHYLKNVTGELKTRAPTQALRTDQKDLQVLSGNQSSSARESLEIAKARTNEFGPDNMLESHSPAIVSESRGGAADHDLRNDDHHRHHEEDEEDLSNAIQLALQAIQGKNNVHQSGERDREGGKEGGGYKGATVLLRREHD